MRQKKDIDATSRRSVMVRDLFYESENLSSSSMHALSSPSPTGLFLGGDIKKSNIMMRFVQQDVKILLLLEFKFNELLL